MTRERTATRRRKGCVIAVTANGRRCWRATLTVNGRAFQKQSRDRAVCEEWLKGMLERHPVYSSDNNRAGAWETRRRNGRANGPHRYPKSPRYAVAVECDPGTAHWHIRVGRDWPVPKAVITYDTLSQTPVAWVIDDNGGGGYTFPAARRRLAGLPPLQGGSYAIRRKDTLRYRNRFD
ncbi:MAG: hypothetical protein LUD72_01105 [Bacteroidales bacterium]|nr:hypothetical protein [Bacteroidales bacterium]